MHRETKGLYTHSAREHTMLPPQGCKQGTNRESGQTNINRSSPINARYCLTVCALTLRAVAKLLPMLAHSPHPHMLLLCFALLLPPARPHRFLLLHAGSSSRSVASHPPVLVFTSVWDHHIAQPANVLSPQAVLEQYSAAAYSYHYTKQCSQSLHRWSTPLCC